jgi:2-dehydro-3-deoxy-D-pentonate aldolase
MSDFQFYVAQLSLVDSQGHPRPEWIAAHLHWLKQNGVDGVLILGTNGEFPHFSVAQRKQYLETLLPLNPGLELMVNIGAANLPDVLELQEHALSLSGNFSTSTASPPCWPKS